MKIALITTYDFAIPGGVRNHIIELANALTHQGYCVKVIAPSSHPLIDPGVEHFIQIAKFPSAAKTGFIPPHLLLSLNVIPRLRRVLNQEKFDLIHVHEPLLPPLCLSLLFYKRTPIIATFHTYYEKGQPMYRVLQPVFNRLLKRLKDRIVVSEPAKAYIHQYFPYDYKIIPNGVNIKKYSRPIAPVAELTPGYFNVLFIGHAQFRRKGLKYLLEAFRLLKADYPKLRLVIAGTKWSGRHQPKALDTTDLKDIIYLGTVTENQLIGLYQQADIFCAPSTGNESFGMVLIEAMAAGAPIVATRIEGYARVVQHGLDAHLVEPKDSQALAVGLKHVIDDKAYRERLVNQARLNVKRYDWEGVAQEIAALYV